jgi:N6-L-threonylcarbamoyladenine synthase
MIFLGIETSCDDTAVALVENGRNVLANIVANQDEYHRQFGGIVPEIAARKHLEHILPSIKHALEMARIDASDLTAIAVTHRPGLIGSLIVGLAAAKTIAFVLEKPLIGIHHIEAHAYASVLSGMAYGQNHIALVASGGHTSLLEFRNGIMRLIGRTVDDAAGEAYDKVSKVMGLGYPGGPILDKLAGKGNASITRFPRPMLERDNFNFSFSGLKTAVMYYLHQNPKVDPADLAAAFQEAVVDVLVTKTLSAARKIGLRAVSVVGGVAANSGLRGEFTKRCADRGFELFLPRLEYCTDNAAMVAGLAYQKWNEGFRSNIMLGAFADADMKLTDFE